MNLLAASSEECIFQEIKVGFQPIVDSNLNSIFANEALTRGAFGESFNDLIREFSLNKIYKFDEYARAASLHKFVSSSMNGKLSLNFYPNTLGCSENCITKTLDIAHDIGFPISNLIFEISELEKTSNPKLLKEFSDKYKEQGVQLAFDDFGAGHMTLNSLIKYQPDIVKLDIVLIKDIDKNKVNQVVVKNFVKTLNDLGIAIIAEGVETVGEHEFLKGLGVYLFQGYFFAKPSFADPPKLTSATP